jgi:ABC-type branched-subunit amino acid transport system substrate-binding protein
MEQVRRTILPGDEGVGIEPVTAPPKKIVKADAAKPIAPAKPAPPVAARAPAVSPGNEATASIPSTNVAGLPPNATQSGPQAGRLVLIPPPGVEPTVRVGLLLPLSGSHAKLGQSLLNAAQLALFDIASEGLALLPVDTEGTTAGAAAAARRALDDGARVILGPVFSSSVAAVAPIARARGVQVVSFSNDRAVAGNGVYVMGFSPETQIRRVMTYARDRGLKRLAALVPEGPYGDRVEQILHSLIPVLGMEMKAVARYRGESTEALSPVVKRLANYDARRAVLLARRKELEAETDEASKRALKRLEKRDTLGDVDFDGVFLPQGGASLRALAPLLRFYDVDPRKVRVLGTVGWNDPIFATEPALYGGWFTAPPPAARQGFETAYKKAFGSTAPPVASLAYDATALAAVIARPPDPVPKPDPGSEKVVAVNTLAPSIPVPPPPRLPGEIFTAPALMAANGFAGADGIFRLLPSGLVERGFAVMEVRARRFVVVSPAPQTFQTLGNQSTFQPN